MISTGLNVTIIGGGIAGALAARVLREQHNVTVLERSTDPAEVGAAINVGPNGTRILAKLNFDLKRTGSIPVGNLRTWNKAGEMVGDTETDYEKEYGSPWLFQHRADLRSEFLRLATAPGEELGLKGNPAEVRYGSKAVDLDVESGMVTLEGGDKIEADLVIGEQRDTGCQFDQS
jgi:salicylate hydroxylase